MLVDLRFLPETLLLFRHDCLLGVLRRTLTPAGSGNTPWAVRLPVESPAIAFSRLLRGVSDHEGELARHWRFSKLTSRYSRRETALMSITGVPSMPRGPG